MLVCPKGRGVPENLHNIVGYVTVGLFIQELHFSQET